MEAKTKRRIVKIGNIKDLPENYQLSVMNAHKIVVNKIHELLDDPKCSEIKNSSVAMSAIDEFCLKPGMDKEVGKVTLSKYGDEYECMIQLTGHFRHLGFNENGGKYIGELVHAFIREVYGQVKKEIKERCNLRLENECGDADIYERFDVYLNHAVAKEMWDNDWYDKEEISLKESIDYYVESVMTQEEKEAKKTLKTLSSQLIKDLNNEDKKKNMTQYTANIYSNIITKNLLKIWAPGYKKFSITLDSYQSFYTFEFKIPTMSQDFISRFVAGRESIQGFLHRIPEIKIKMSPRIFHTMNNPDDAFNFFKAAITYYDSKIEKYSISLMTEVMRLDRGLKHLISSTKLSGLVTYPMQLLFVFDDVNMNNYKTFDISKEDIKTVNQFIKNISTRYAAPEKEKKAIISDVKDMIKALHEYCEMDINVNSLDYLPTEIEKYYNGYYKESIDKVNEEFIYENIDKEWSIDPGNREVKYLQEKFGVKKLKRIPVDLVAYIQIETEAIKDANDKMMISSYCLSKLEIVEWYIELLEVGSKKYIVPHSKQYLETVRTQLLACFKKIMDTPVSKPSERPIVDIKYPKGYEG